MSILCNHVVGRKCLGNKTPGKPVPACWAQIVAGEDATTPECVYEASRHLVAAGLSVIPIDAYEGSKGPDSSRLPRPHDPVDGRSRPSWSIFQIRRPTMDELDGWFKVGGIYGLAVLGGTVSGGQHGHGLEIIDFDTASLVEPWSAAVEAKAPGLISRLVRITTPRPGLHIYYRCSRYGVSQKLAFAPAVDEFGHPALDSHGRPIKKATVEAKAEGGYCLIPPSPPRCHPTGRLYRYAEGSSELTAVPTITPTERNILLDAARSLNRWSEPTPVQQRTKCRRNNNAQTLPGNDFNTRADWDDILPKHGWICVGTYGDETRWCRPGKDGGVSATSNHGGSGLLHVFSSNAEPFEAERSYSKFSAYALLEHGGDFVAAARDLRKQGYGARSLKAG
ncbi:MAG: hypothetical protein FJ271_28285 [Planctomycetes bacterium]|nr:hypothetical protein [Planctomycetota bacterium]